MEFKYDDISQNLSVKRLSIMLNLIMETTISSGHTVLVTSGTLDQKVTIFRHHIFTVSNCGLSPSLVRGTSQGVSSDDFVFISGDEKVTIFRHHIFIVVKRYVVLVLFRDAMETMSSYNFVSISGDKKMTIFRHNIFIVLLLHLYSTYVLYFFR